ncbi:tetratricopeptide repeat protein [Lentisphaerota bacterium WC36G]|nr:tetratricopeptide repeat protein [Lentisphaerae bacterium WC36]
MQYVKKLFLYFIFISSALLLTNISFAAEIVSYNEYIQKKLDKVKHLPLKEQIKELTKQLTPSNYILMFAIADLCVKAKEYKQAEKLYVEAIKLRDDAHQIKKLAELYELHLKNPKKAIFYYDKIKNYLTQHPDIKLRMAVIIYKHYRNFKAVEKILQFYSVNDKTYNENYDLGRVYEDAEVCLAALNWYHDLRALKKPVKTHLCTARVYESIHNTKQAVTWYNKAIEAKVPQAHLQFALYYCRQNDFDNAFKQYEIIKDKNKNDAAFIIGEIALRKNNLKEAAENFKIVAESGDVKAIRRLGLIAKMNKNYQEAIRHYRMALKLDCPEAAAEIGAVYEEQKNYKKAIAWYKKAESLYFHPATYHLGRLYLYKLKNQKIGFKYLHKSIKKGYKHIIIEIGDYYKKQKNYDKASKYYLSSIKKFNYSAGYIKLGELFEIAKKYDKAQKCYEKAMKSFRTFFNAQEKLIALLNSQGKTEEAKKVAAKKIKPID